MNKIPVGRTIAQSYGFVLGRYFTLLGLVWLPYAIFAGASLLLMRPFYRDIMAAMPQSGRPEAAFAFMHNFPLIMLLNLMMLALATVMAVGIAREALAIPQKIKFVYFRLTMDEVRTAGAILFLVAMLYVVFFAVVMLGAILGGIVVAILAASGGSQDNLNPAIVALEVLVVIGVVAFVIGMAVVYFGIRLSFVFIPVTITEQRFGLWRSWDLMHGNFWRALAVGFVTALPIVVIEAAFLYFSLGPSYFAVFRHLGDPHAVMEQMQQIRSRIEAPSTFLPYIWAVGLLVAPIVYGLAVAPGVFAYRVLVPDTGKQNRETQ